MCPDNSVAHVSAPQLKERINDASRMLKKYGIRKGFIAALFLNNSIDFISIFFALIEIGATPIPVNMAFRAIELDEIFSNADPHAVITEKDHLKVIMKYLSGRIVVERNGGNFLMRDSGAGGFGRGPAEVDHSIATINYTYRGYGYPLGAMVPHIQYLFGSELLQEAVRLDAGERLLVVLPMPHIFTLIGCIFLPLIYGITPVISRSRNPLRLFETVHAYQIQNILAVPELYELLYKFRDSAGDCTPLNAFLSGGSVMPDEMYGRLVDEFDVDLIHGYGLTEFTPVSRNIRGDIRPGTIGMVCDGLEYKIDPCDEFGFGEILIRTENMTKAYYRRSAESRDVFQNGWFRTGDIGRVEDGHLIFKREKKKTRKVKGNMVDLLEVQRILMEYPKMRNAIIECNDSILSAAVEIDSARNFDSEVLSIKKFLEDRIAGYKIPKIFSRI
ncbi:MAG: acyl--CoA ligase [Spirochaetes bacterium]|nr:acyl--CoA ligase [Spirochaetota bacterium]